jgi:hypothetical protein
LLGLLLVLRSLLRGGLRCGTLEGQQVGDGAVLLVLSLLSNLRPDLALFGDAAGARFGAFMREPGRSLITPTYPIPLHTSAGL